MLQCETGEEMMTTVYVYIHHYLWRKTGISWNKYIHNKPSQAHRLREFCDGGNGEPKATLNNVRCRVSVDQQYHVH